MSSRVVSEYKDAFDMFNISKSGKISKAELKDMLSKLGQKCDVKEVDRLMDAADKDSEYTYLNVYRLAHCWYNGFFILFICCTINVS